MSRNAISRFAFHGIIVILLGGITLLSSGKDGRGPIPPGPISVLAVSSVQESVPVRGGDLNAIPGGGGTPLTFTLGDAEARDQNAATVDEPPNRSLGTLSDAEMEALLGRLPPLQSGGGVEYEFAKTSLKPPLSGQDKQTPFPPDDDLPHPPGAVAEATAKPLTVLRHSPEGELQTIHKVSLTFSAAMVSLSSVEKVSGAEIPVTLEPHLDGEWRWLDTRTLQFLPESPSKRSTVYTIRTKEGIRSANGSTLESPHSWEIKTPIIRVVETQPRNGMRGVTLQPALFVAFDQPIDPRAVHPTIRVTVGDREFPHRLAKRAEAKEFKDRAAEGHWLALVLQEKLPKNERVTVTIGPGTPSAEGPRLTTSPHQVSFQTYGPFVVTGTGCIGSSRCYADENTGFHASLSNAVVAESFRPGRMTVTPRLGNQKITLNGNSIYFSGTTKPDTDYTITVDAKLADIYGQELTGERTFVIRTQARPPPPPPRPPPPPVYHSWLRPSGTQFFVLDPSSAHQYEIECANREKLQVDLYSVDPTDYEVYLRDFVNLFYDARTRVEAKVPGKLVSSTVLTFDADPDVPVKTEIDLRPALDDGIGQVVVVVQPMGDGETSMYGQSLVAWIQSTHLGLTVVSESDELIAWVTGLADGSPVRSAEVTLLGTEPMATVRTDADGIALIEGTGSLLVARDGRDSAFLPAQHWRVGSGHASQLLWHTLDDRKLYRPGERVRVKGWVREMDLREGGDLESLDPETADIGYRVYDPRSIELTSGTLPLTREGGFHLEFDLPDNANLGNGRIDFTAKGVDSVVSRAQYRHSFQIQEFRRPEFEVTIAPDDPYLWGEEVVVPLMASYYAGGPLADTPTTWTVSATPTTYRPPNLSQFQFGAAVSPSYGYYPYELTPSVAPGRSGGGRYYDTYDYGYGYGFGYNVQRLTHQGTTDQQGLHLLQVALDGGDPTSPILVDLTASVTDVTNQTWSSHASFTVHPSTVYLGMRSNRQFVESGDVVEIDTITTDVDGNPVTGRPLQVFGTSPNGDSEVCRTTSEQGIARCLFRAEDPGQYWFRGVVSDEDGRPAVTSTSVWVSTGKGREGTRVGSDRMMLVTDKTEYLPGETAEILVQSPFFPASGLMTVRRSGVISHQPFALEGEVATLKLDIEDAHVPGLDIQVDLVGSQLRFNQAGDPDPHLPARPARASARLQLSVSSQLRTLTVQVEPREPVMEPGATSSVDVQVLDAFGTPVPGAEVLLMAADESVLALAGYQLQDPMETFYPARVTYAGFADLRSLIVLEEQVVAAADPGLQPSAAAAEDEMSRASRSSSAFGAAADGMGVAGATAGAPAIQLRERLSPFALFEPDATTGRDGQVTVPIELPDDVTRYRLVAVAASGPRSFGHAESTITARKSLMVRASPPRFLNFGDSFVLPVVVQNATDQEMVVQLAIRADNLQIDGPAGFETRIPARGRTELRFPASTRRAGVARFQVAASAGDSSDAVELAVPVWTPATSEAFAVYGEIDHGSIVQPVAAPPGVISEFGGLEITTSSTALHALTDAVIFLTNYPYRANEQIASRVLGIVSLIDVLAAFEASGLPPSDEVLAVVQADLDLLSKRQGSDGGFSYWTYDRCTIPYVSIHVAHALVRADAAGVALPEGMLDRAEVYLTNIDNGISAYQSCYRVRVGPQEHAALVAYSLDVRSRLGHDVSDRASTLLEDPGLDAMTLETAGWILAALTRSHGPEEDIARVRRHLLNRVEETASAANFVSGYSGEAAQAMLHSDRRSDAVILAALIEADPDNELIAKVVRGLLAHRRKGRWRNTQENAFVLVALQRYFTEYEGVSPDFVARVWLGDQYAGEQRYEGYNADRQHLEIPMGFLQEVATEQPSNLILNKDGQGRLYYRLGMRYAPQDLDLDPLERGFFVDRSYEAVSEPDDVHQSPDGTWHVQQGATVRVVVSMRTTSRRYHVALVDPLPAGFEPLNPAIAMSSLDQTTPATPPPYYWSRYWFEHQNLRDDRAESFTPLLWEGEYTYSYLARATTVGEFVVPPPKAEEMYTPETFGRGATAFVHVEEPLQIVTAPQR